MASQVTLPSIGAPRGQSGSLHARLHPWRRRQFLRDNRCEDVRISQAVNLRLVLHRRLGDLEIAPLVKRLSSVRGVLSPFCKLLWRYDVNVEMHVSESVAAELRRQALKRPARIRPQIEPRGHAV